MSGGRRTTRLARQLFRLCLASGRLDDDRVRRVVQRVLKSARRDRIGLLTQFERLVRLDRDRHSALVESAVPLTPDVQNAVRARLTHAYGAGMEATFTENPALIGGMRIRVGSDVYDGSLRARLAALEARL